MSITQIKYNREGDLIFSVAKDTVANVWYSVNGERLGTYNGHTGAVWCVDCDWDTKNVLTGSADNSCRLWDCETGRYHHSLSPFCLCRGQPALPVTTLQRLQDHQCCVGTPGRVCHCRSREWRDQPVQRQGWTHWLQGLTLVNKIEY
uniref:Serine-threonine kinase receptor-associated protein n=1 Tax=Mola mola TaxID=94237 RepID=A0A3Q3XLM5_MOLML